jgi:predicted secreted protein
MRPLLEVVPFSQVRKLLLSPPHRVSIRQLPGPDPSDYLMLELRQISPEHYAPAFCQR